MSWLVSMNRALDYIEENLAGEIELAKAARLAGQSLSSLLRVFSILADMPLSEYIRRRRLTLAAFELHNSSIKVVDLALKYGYESPEAFTRAFSAVHGLAPTLARQEGASLKAWPRLSFLLTVKGDVPMDYRIETREAFAVYGIEGIFTTENGDNLKAIPEFWLQTLQDGRYDRLARSAHADGDENELCIVNAICDYRHVPGYCFPYMICAFKTPQSDTEGFVEVNVPAATWAVFRSEKHTVEQTSAVMQNLVRRVYTDWLPTANYDKMDGYEMELYYGSGDHCRCETWIRVKHRDQ